MSEQTRYYLTELLMKHNLPMVQGRELVFAEYHDDEIAKLKVLILEAAKVLRLNMGGFDRVKAQSMAHKLEREAAK